MAIEALRENRQEAVLEEYVLVKTILTTRTFRFSKIQWKTTERHHLLIQRSPPCKKVSTEIAMQEPELFDMAEKRFVCEKLRTF